MSTVCKHIFSLVTGLLVLKYLKDFCFNRKAQTACSNFKRAGTFKPLLPGGWSRRWELFFWPKNGHLLYFNWVPGIKRPSHLFSWEWSHCFSQGGLFHSLGIQKVPTAGHTGHCVCPFSSRSSLTAQDAVPSLYAVISSSLPSCMVRMWHTRQQMSRLAS